MIERHLYSLVSSLTKSVLKGFFVALGHNCESNIFLYSIFPEREYLRPQVKGTNK